MRAGNRFARPRFPCRAVALRRLALTRLSFRLKEVAIKNFVNKRRLARPRHASDAVENAERDFDVEGFQIVLPRTGDSYRSRRFAARPWDGTRLATREIIACQSLRSAHDSRAVICDSPIPLSFSCP